MADPTLTITPSEDRKSAVLQFQAGEVEVEMDITAFEIDTMIGNLAAARATLAPPVPTIHLNAPLRMPVRAQAVIPAERIAGRRMVLFRHPGFGWLAFELGQGDGAELAAGIAAAVQADGSPSRRS